MKILITGGAGFIGSEVVRQYILLSENIIINVDKLTYAGNLESLSDVFHHPRHVFKKLDICNVQAVEEVVFEHKPDAIMHLAAESHVDKSIVEPDQFINTNIVGSYNILEVSRHYWEGLKGKKKDNFRLHHISTDEVYGELDDTAQAFTEETPYNPSSPYSASKAASDHLVRAWYRTYELPVIITNCSNNYGPYQFPEKLIPLMILNALARKPLPVYGEGKNIRDWLHVEDHARGLRTALESGVLGRTYNIGSRSERTNLDVVYTICDLLQELLPPNNMGSKNNMMQIKHYRDLITFVNDRPGHDYRYAIDNSRIIEELGWAPKHDFESGLKQTILWYINNQEWVARVHTGAYMDVAKPILKI